MRVFITILFIITSYYIYAQEGVVYTSDDGTKINVITTSDDPDAVNKLNVQARLELLETYYFAKLNYYSPKQYFINLNLGFGFQLDGNVFFYNHLKDSFFKKGVKHSYNPKYEGNKLVYKPTIYKLKKAIPKRVSYGVHLGYVNGFSGNEIVELPRGYITKYDGVIVGLTRLVAKQVELNIDKYNFGGKRNTLRGQYIGRINMDAVFYTNAIYYNNYNTRRISTVYEANDRGARIYYEGDFSIWSEKGKLTMSFLAGIAQVASPINVNLFYGVGMGYRFL